MAVNSFQFAARRPYGELQEGQTVSVAIRPEKMALRSGPARDRKMLMGTVEEIIYICTDYRDHLPAFRRMPRLA